MLIKHLNTIFLMAFFIISPLATAEHFESCLSTDCANRMSQLLNAVKNGDVEAMRLLAQRYYFGDRTTLNKEKALQFFERAADQGDVVASYYAGVIRLSDNSYKDIIKGVKYLEQSASTNFTNSSHLLAVIYLNQGYGLYNLEKADLYLSQSYQTKDPNFSLVLAEVEASQSVGPEYFPTLYRSRLKSPLLLHVKQQLRWETNDSSNFSINCTIEIETALIKCTNLLAI